MVRLGIVEDTPTVRKRLLERLSFFDNVEVTLVADSGFTFLEQFRGLSAGRKPEVILMDIEMPGMSGIEATKQIKVDFPELEIMMFTVFEQEDRIFDSIKAGASGYLLKETPAAAIMAAVQELLSGGAPMSPAVARKMLGFVRSHGDTPPKAKTTPQFKLSKRELDILKLLVADDTEAMIGDTLHISPHTVRTHIKNIYKKLGVKSRHEAMARAYDAGGY